MSKNLILLDFFIIFVSFSFVSYAGSRELSNSTGDITLDLDVLYQELGDVKPKIALNDKLISKLAGQISELKTSINSKYSEINLVKSELMFLEYDLTADGEELQVLRKNMADLKDGIAHDLEALSSLVMKMEINNINLRRIQIVIH